MKRISKLNRVPHGGGYSLNLPEMGIVGSGMNFNSLVRSVSEWRRANSIPVGLGFEAEIEREVCARYPDECEGGPLAKPRKSRLSLGAVLRGTQVLLTFKMAGSPYVEPVEANRRAAICSGCAWNQDYAKPCGGNCGGLKELVTAIVGGNQTPYDEQLKSCGVCGCVSKAHIWLPLSFLEKGVTSEMKEQFATIENCWKKV